MDGFTVLLTPEWRIGTGAVVGGFGLVVLWRGLAGRHGLLRRRASLLDRLDGWQHILFGLTLLGLAAAWALDSRLFLFLTLGIAFTELREASAVISALKRERRPEAGNGA